MSERRLFMNGAVTTESVNELIEMIKSINDEDEFNYRNIVGYDPEPIELIVHSTGGEVNAGFGLIDVMEESITPIYTICYGSAFSMALAIFLAGDVRYSGKRSSYMYHQLSHAYDGKTNEHKLNTRELERLQKIYDEYLISRTHFTQEDLDKAGTIDLYMSAEVAKELGIVDYILDPNAEDEEEELVDDIEVLEVD